MTNALTGNTAIFPAVYAYESLEVDPYRIIRSQDFNTHTWPDFDTHRAQSTALCLLQLMTIPSNSRLKFGCLDLQAVEPEIR